MDLTYGSCGQTNADPALQPLISLTATKFALPPALVLNSDFRRNFAVLLNRMPTEKAVYSRISKQRESICRDETGTKFVKAGYRIWSGPWPGRSDLPDVDLAVISDREKHCLFIELKAFVEPAEAREIVQRDEEVAKGIQQSKLLRAAFQEDSTNIRRRLRIDDLYTGSFIVASESGIGSCLVKDRSISVIRTAHLLKRMRAIGSLTELCNWLDRGEFLPVKGVQYDEVTVIKHVGSWELEWYGIKPLLSSEFV